MQANLETKRVEKLGGSVSGNVVQAGIIQIAGNYKFGFVVTKQEHSGDEYLHMWFKARNEEWTVKSSTDALTSGSFDVDIMYVRTPDKPDNWANYIMTVVDNSLDRPSLSFKFIQIDENDELVIINTPYVKTFDERITHCHSQVIAGVAESDTNKQGIFTQLLL